MTSLFSVHVVARLSRCCQGWRKGNKLPVASCSGLQPTWPCTASQRSYFNPKTAALASALLSGCACKHTEWCPGAGYCGVHQSWSWQFVSLARRSITNIMSVFLSRVCVHTSTKQCVVPDSLCMASLLNGSQEAFKQKVNTSPRGRFIIKYLSSKKLCFWICCAPRIRNYKLCSCFEE